MGLGRWLRKIFTSSPPPRTVPAPEPRAAHSSRPSPTTQENSSASNEDEYDFPKRRGGEGPLDASSGTEGPLLARIGERVQAQDFRLPVLPSTSMRLLELSNDTGVELGHIASAVEADPVLSSELLKTANSVVLGGTQKTKTISDAVVRLGIKNLRTLILGLSMKSVLLRNKGLMQYANEVWRQCTSMAALAGAIGTAQRHDPERAFLVGLLHDIGKVALLDLIQQEASTRFVVNRALVGRVFHDWHEVAGAQMAKAWQLPPEIAAVAANHHDFKSNVVEPAGAAVASLAHKMDLLLCLGAETEYRALADGLEMKTLDLDWEQSKKLLGRGVQVFSASNAAAASS